MNALQNIGMPFKRWWDDTRILALFCCLMAVPLLSPSLPPLTDLYSHIARYRVQLDGGNSPYLSAYFRFDWQLIGNLGVDLLIIPLAPLLGLELSVKVIVMSIPMLFAAGIFWVSREVHGRVTPFSFLALPLAYCYPFHFGFVNFMLSMALALNAFALWLHLGRQRRLMLRAALFVPLGLALWVAHSFGWALLAMLCGTWEVVRAVRVDKQKWSRALFGAALRCLPLVPPLLLMIAWRQGNAEGGTGDWFNLPAKLDWMVMIFMDRWALFDQITLGAFVLVAGWGYVLPHRRLSPELLVSAVLLLVMFFLLPRVVFGSAFADMRLAPFILLFFTLAVDVDDLLPRRAIYQLISAVLAFAGVRIIATTASLNLFGERHEMALKALDHIPTGSRVAAFVPDCRYMGWKQHRAGHLPSVATVRREAFTNNQFAMKGAQLMSIRKIDAPLLQADPSQYVSTPNCHTRSPRLSEALAQLPRQAFDQVWLIGLDVNDDMPSQGFVLVWSNGKDHLFAIQKPNKAATTKE